MGTLQLYMKGWEFAKTPYGTEIENIQDGQYSFEPVELPHDWLIGDSRNLYEDSCGWYRNKLVMAEPVPERVILRFDGVYMDSTLYVNGQGVGDWKYGYSTFEMDISDFLHTGENILLLQVRFRSPNSRWYSGAGIYRRVWLQICGKAFLPVDGCRVETAACPGGFWLDISTEVECADPSVDEELECRYFLCVDPCRGDKPPERRTGRARVGEEAPSLLECTAPCRGNKPPERRTGRARVGEDGALVQDLGRQQWRRIADPEETGSVYLARQGGTGGRILLMGTKVQIPSPALWDLEDPACYELQVELWQKGVQLDRQIITIGFRTMVFDPDEGFLLNGKRIKVHGVCEHHDLGCLGAAFSSCAMERKLRILRGMGVNAIRTSHNMPDPQVMGLADRMGFLVVNEAFDMWESSKTAYDYGRFFKEWAERDVASWIRRDRNHPSLMLWSIGNEISDTCDEKRGMEITNRLAGWVRRHDRRTPVTIGSNNMFWESARKCSDILKIAGYNYGEKYYREHHEQYPDWVIYGSETASVVQSRGIYHFPASKSILADEDEQCSALGNSATSWGAKSIERCIVDDRDAEFAFGQFIWTGFDYIGEPTPYHTKNSYFGQVDTAGFPKDSYYIFAAEWTDAKENPMVHLFPYWDFNEGQMIDVRASTNQPCVELFVNDVSHGMQRIDHARGRKLLGEWQVRYHPGTIRAVAYDGEGRAVAWDSHTSFGDSRRIRLTPDRQALQVGSGELCFLTIETLDEKGNPVENAADYVQVDVSGDGRLVGLDNGDSTDYDSYRSHCRKLFSGKLLAVVGAGEEAGLITVRVAGNGLEPAQVYIPVLSAAAPERIQVSLPVPVRKIELRRAGEGILTRQQPETVIDAVIYPEGADVRELVWKVVNDGGIEVDHARIAGSEGSEESPVQKRVTVRALGDGSFRVRCMARNSEGRIALISQLELEAAGLGRRCLDPYTFISAGLCSDTIGEIGNGNEKGIATARDGRSGVVFENLDFGSFGADELIMPVFALSGEAYPIEIWIGNPKREGSRLLDTVIYQKPSIWNTYQEERWKLPRRIKGIVTLAFCLNAKVHIKGFSFTRQQKGYTYLTAAEADRIYGDSFRIEGKRVLEIGNNVTLEYQEMDFGDAGTSDIAIWGNTPLQTNEIHIAFTPETEAGDGITQECIVRFDAGGAAKGEAVKRIFPGICFAGKGKLAFLFLPGSNFDFEAFAFGSADAVERKELIQ